MTQARWQLALRAHREAHPEHLDPDHTRLMFVACSESTAAESLLAAFPAAYVLQTFMDLPRDLGAAARATLEYGILVEGVRQVVVCGDQSCRVDGDVPVAEASQAALFARCRALLDDAHTGPILRRARVAIRALWFDEASHDVYACDVESGTTRPMGDIDLAAMFAHFDELTA